MRGASKQDSIAVVLFVNIIGTYNIDNINFNITYRWNTQLVTKESDSKILIYLLRCALTSGEQYIYFDAETRRLVQPKPKPGTHEMTHDPSSSHSSPRFTFYLAFCLPLWALLLFLSKPLPFDQLFTQSTYFTPLKTNFWLSMLLFFSPLMSSTKRLFFSLLFRSQ